MDTYSYQLTEKKLFEYPTLRKRTDMLKLRIKELEKEHKADVLSYITTNNIQSPKDKNLMIICESNHKINAIKLLKKELKLKKRELIEIELALSTLYENEYKLIALRYFRAAKMTEISEILGITREYASRLKKITLKKIALILFG